MRRVMGIDLGGARTATTGIALLEGDHGPPCLISVTTLSKVSAAEAERRLLALIEKARPTVVAIDAPLTLPPCLSCPSFCRGPDPKLCELDTARQIWEAHGHPVTERLCEVRLREELRAGPLPTMRIGQIAARGVALARRIVAGGTHLGPAGAVEVLEVYPYATLHRLGLTDRRLAPRGRAEAELDFEQRIRAGFSEAIHGLDSTATPFGPHGVDALVAAWTGWIAPDGLEPAPPNFNAASGWIWMPARPDAPSAP